MFGKKKVPLQAKILADEGYTYARNSGQVALQHQKYIIEVHPEGEPPFRTEIKGWVSWLEKPAVGDMVPVLFEPGTHNVDLHLDGDPRFDWNLRAANRVAEQAARRNELLNGPIPED